MSTFMNDTSKVTLASICKDYYRLFPPGWTRWKNYIVRRSEHWIQCVAFSTSSCSKTYIPMLCFEYLPTPLFPPSFPYFTQRLIDRHADYWVDYKRHASKMLNVFQKVQSQFLPQIDAALTDEQMHQMVVACPYADLNWLCPYYHCTNFALSGHFAESRHAYNQLESVAEGLDGLVPVLETARKCTVCETPESVRILLDEVQETKLNYFKGKI